ncbi:DUF6941 family protein [Ornithinimicrobium tianjinense]|uniref:Uncharacterized protein n=1 Tax=Ornithinimicrobium tianjinense TaxID=1195761 RepID=A0A917F5Q1_9MICO|nr:hypothetical protein [Ornithinimicrobium tianjinense]GGF49140.1 hypothetical protein GCM10011366_16290 [Ornithinimicrobium tianjinense]
MKLTLLLADSAQEAQGKVHALGLGWTAIGTPTSPMALVVLLDVDWDETNRDIALHIELVDADGHLVTVPGPFGDQPLTLDATAQAGRPPGMPRGAAVRLPLTLNVSGGLPLVAGQRYEWRATLNGQADAAWAQSFHVLASPPHE